MQLGPGDQRFERLLQAAPERRNRILHRHRRGRDDAPVHQAVAFQPAQCFGQGLVRDRIEATFDRVELAGYGTYAATKAAVRSYARTWTHELAGRGIRVNTLSPGPTDTPMFDGAADDVRQALTDRIPFKRLGRPEEIADAALFLASADSSFVGGADLHVDGGMVA